MLLANRVRGVAVTVACASCAARGRPLLVTRQCSPSMSCVTLQRRCQSTAASGAAAVAASSTTTASPSMSSSSAASDGKASGGDQFSHITRNLVWSLWNDGNLFSLSTLELHHFLRAHCGLANVNVHDKKSALVRQVEEVLSAEQANVTVPQEDNAHAVVVTDYDRVEEALDEADDYGDWGAEPGFEQRRAIDYMEISPARLSERYDPLAPRAYQLLHSHVSSDVQLRRVDPRKLPGQSKCIEAYAVSSINANEGNKQRFRRAFKWCVANAWNMNAPSELNIGAGKVLFYRTTAKQNRNVLPKWTLQRHLYNNHPYAWFAIASESNVAAMEALAERLGMRLVQDATTTYRLTIKRMGEQIDCELNAQLQCTKVNRSWDRFLVAHFVRARAPDLRYVVRGRHPIKKRVADAYLETDVLRGSRDSVQSVLAPELGEVVYCCERVMRKWAMRTATGATLQLVETRRTPLIIHKVGDEGERLEYEWIVPIPQKAERLDISRMSDELWEYGNTLASALEEGMEDLMAHVMTAASTY